MLCNYIIYIVLAISNYKVIAKLDMGGYKSVCKVVLLSCYCAEYDYLSM